MQIPRDARAADDKPITPTYAALEQWVQRYSVRSSGRGVRIRQLPNETLVYAVPQGQKLRHPFRVSISGAAARIRPGFLNGEIPRLGPDLIRLDGVDTEGDETGSRPALALLENADEEANGPGPDGRSFVCLRVSVDPVTELPLPGDEEGSFDPEWLTVVHRSELPAGFVSGGMPESLEGDQTVGLWPLGVCYWTAEGDRVRRTLPYTQHNLQWRYEAAELREGEETARPGRHWFFGAT